MYHREPERASEILRAAAAWCRDNGDLDRALRYLMRAGDTDHAAALVARRAPLLLMQGDIGRHQAWLQLFPPDVVRNDPQLLLTKAWSELFADRPHEALVDLARLERIAPEGFVAGKAGRLELMQAIAAWFDGRPVECVEHAHRSLELLAEADLGSRCVSHLYCGVGELVVGESSDAVRQLEFALDAALRTGNGYTAFSAQVATGAVKLRDGDLEQALFFFQAALDRRPDVDDDGGDFPIGGSGNLGCGIVAFEQLELEVATDAFRQALTELRKTTAVDYSSLAYRRWAEARSLLGDYREADEIIDEARQYLTGFGESRALVLGLDACQARNALRAGNLDRARDLVDRSGSAAQRGAREFDSPEFEHAATTVRLDLAVHRPDLARDQLAKLYRLAATRRGPEIEVATLQAGIRLALGQPDEASSALDEAVRLASTGGWLRLLVDVDPTVTTLLGQRSTASDDGAGRLVERALAASRPSPSSVPRAQPLVDPLTARELEVLAEVAAGLTNAEIAERLYISVGTTKRHVANIFVKLAAKHRAEAIAQARTLGIID
jgi:LuxR family maltose regulon positive regulatory protein